MSQIGDAIQEKCLAFGDRIIKLNDYLLETTANQKSAFHVIKGKRVYEKAVPVHLKSVANISNQLLRAGTNIGANNAEATNAISKADFKSRSFIALKEARESLYWIELLHRNNYLADELTLTSALGSVSIINHQADMLVMLSLRTAADLTQQLEFHRIQ